MNDQMFQSIDGHLKGILGELQSLNARLDGVAEKLMGATPTSKGSSLSDIAQPLTRLIDLLGDLSRGLS